MRQIFIFCVGLVLVNHVLAQELINNGGFEDHVCLPQHISEINCCVGWSEINWVPNGNPPYGTPDYYIDSATYNLNSIVNTDCRVQTHEGAATMRIGVFRKSLRDYREYLATRLVQPLKAGAKYNLSFWVTNGYSFPDSSNVGYSCARLGFNFTKDRMTGVPHKVILGNPQVVVSEMLWSSEWKEYKFQFVAQDAYEYMTIGFFLNDAQIYCVDNLAHQSNIPENRSGYYFFDEISLEQEESVWGDTVICLGDSAQLNAFFNNGQYAWVDASTPDRILSNSASLAVKPTETTTYAVYSGGRNFELTVRVVPDKIDVLGNDTNLCKGEHVDLLVPLHIDKFQWQDGSEQRYYPITETGEYRLEVFDKHCIMEDSIRAGFEFCGCDAFVPNSFTPNNDYYNDVFHPVLDCPVKQYQFYIFNRWGSIVFQTNSVEEAWDGRTSDGMAPIDTYAYKLVYSLYDGSQYESIGQVHLIR